MTALSPPSTTDARVDDASGFARGSAWVALVLATAAILAAWMGSVFAPIMAQRAADEYRYDDIFTGMIVFAVITVILAGAALVFGIIAARRSRHRVLAGAAIALGAIALLSLPANYISDTLSPFLG